MKTPIALALGLAAGTALSLPAAAQSLGWAMLPALEEAALDVDADGIFTVEEMEIALVPIEFDADVSGDFSVPELTAGYFGQYDVDDSGVLEEEELRAMEGLAAQGVYEYGM
jgi:hypothetical protein